MIGMIDEIYQNVISRLSDSSRARVELTEQNLEKIIEEYEDKIKSSIDIENKKLLLKKYFFILSHANLTSQKTHQSLLNAFEFIKEKKLDTDYFIFLLSAIRRQFIDHQSRTGDKIPMDLIAHLKSLLTNKNPEILEWTLRTIENLGPQSLFFEKEILKLKPSLTKILNVHQRNSFMLVDLIKDNWKRFKK